MPALHRRLPLRTYASIAGVCVAMVAAVGTHGCIIGEPPGDLPRLPETRPTIVQGSVVPTTSAVLATWPDKFIVPVELADPTRQFEWAAFIDYNPSGRGSGLIFTGVSQPTNAPGRIRTLEVPLPAPPLDSCHVVEIIVALELTAVEDPRTAHTPKDPGGDVATWFFNPTGDLAGCPTLDAGIDSSPQSPDGALP